MRKATLMGALLAMLVICLSAMTTVSASATEWLCNGKVLNAKECLILSENLEVIKRQDMSAGSEVDCAVGSVLSEGWVGPGAEDETTSVEFMEPAVNCTAPINTVNLKGEVVKNACEKVEDVKAENLPWLTKLEVINSELWDTITGNTAGSNPAYVITCRASGISGIKDLCENVEAHPLLVAIDQLEPDAESKFKLVDVLFLEKTFEANENEWAKCSIGGANSGLVIGEVLLEAFINNSAVDLEAMD